MPVTSKDISETARIDWSLQLGKAGVALAVVSFGGLFWAVNGGFSVLGLETVATSFNDAGKVFWAVISQWRFSLLAIPGLPATQPIIPWLGVIAASLLQIVTIYRKLKKKAVPRWMLGAVIVLSGYDLATTYFGLGTLAWVLSAGPFVQGLLTLVMTFIVEVSVSLVLRGSSK